ncbi:MAG: hypothetical protein JXA68_00035 [Ignavibacteriales bacterium]|nr:hypothetical protein [Ignavibacteriales bacterium]
MKVQNIGYDDDIICPYCHKVLVTQDNEDYEICEHTIFIDTSDGFEWIRDDLKNVVTELFSEQYDEESLSKFPFKGTLIASESGGLMGLSVYWGFVE